MRPFLSRFRFAFRAFIRNESSRKWVKKDREIFISQLKDIRPDWVIGSDFFCLFDKTKDTGFDRHYVYHPAWAFRKVVNDIRPSKHVDISSILSFSAQLTALMPVEFYDFRPPDIELSDLKVGSIDLMKLPFQDDSIESLSCMHTIEHVGLGRYGDGIDVDGDRKSLNELSRVLSYGGSLLVVVPIGDRSMVHFNAHRVYQPEWIVQALSKLELIEFYYIQSFNKTPKIIPADSSLIKGEHYGCGCFWFKKVK